MASFAVAGVFPYARISSIITQKMDTSWPKGFIRVLSIIEEKNINIKIAFINDLVLIATTTNE